MTERELEDMKRSIYRIERSVAFMAQITIWVVSYLTAKYVHKDLPDIPGWLAGVGMVLLMEYLNFHVFTKQPLD